MNNQYKYNMRYSISFIFISAILVVFSYADYIICEHFYADNRNNECYIVNANSDYLKILIDEGKSKTGFHAYPPQVTIPPTIIEKYNFIQREDACFDSIQCNNYIFHFDCAQSKDMYYLVLRDYYEIGDLKQAYELYDGRNNLYKTLLAVHTFEKDVLSNVGSYHTDMVRRVICLYSEFFFWNQICIYGFIMGFWLLLFLLERIYISMHK